jgi:hypothetical protein
MKVSGVVRFEELSSTGAHVLREFESKNLSGIRFTFGPSPDIAVVQWDSFVRLAVITHMAALVATHQDDPEVTRPMPSDSD